METREKVRKEQQGSCILGWVRLALTASMLCACRVNNQDAIQPSEVTGTTATSLQAPSPSVNAIIYTTKPRRLVGWMSIVWNDHPHFFLTDDGGQTVEILLDEQLTTPFGGPLALDRSRVIVLAVVSSETPDALKALSIELEAGG